MHLLIATSWGFKTLVGHAFNTPGASATEISHEGGVKFKFSGCQNGSPSQVWAILFGYDYYILPCTPSPASGATRFRGSLPVGMASNPSSLSHTASCYVFVPTTSE